MHLGSVIIQEVAALLVCHTVPAGTTYSPSRPFAQRSNVNEVISSRLVSLLF
jgi:hypothetical protein